MKPAYLAAHRVTFDSGQARDDLGVGHGVPQLQRPFELEQHLGGRVARVGLLRGGDGRGQGPRQVVARVGVVGELGGDPRLPDPLGEPLRVPGVQAGALAGQQLLVHRLAQQRVAEDVAVGARARGGARLAVGHQHVVGHRVAQCLLQLVVAQIGDGGQHLVPHLAARHGSDPQHPLGHRRQRLDARHQHLGEPLRHAGRSGGDQLLREERVALAAPGDAPQAGLVDGPVGQPAHQLEGLVAAEGLQLQPLDGGQAHHLRQHRPQRVAAVEVVTAVGGEHDQPLRGQPGEQEDQQIAAGAIGPVQVLDDEQGG